MLMENELHNIFILLFMRLFKFYNPDNELDELTQLIQVFFN